MAKKAKISDRTSDLDTSGDVSERTVSRGRADTSDDAPAAGGRLSFQLDENGQIAWDRLRDKTKSQLKQVLTDPRISSELGAEVPLSPQGAPVDAATIGMLYGAIGALMVGVAKSAGYPQDEAASLLFTPDEKAMLLEPTSRVLVKYTPALGRWEDEIMLSFTLGSIVLAKVSALKKPGKVIDLASRKERDSETKSADD
jgi:hypothetical protein